ncbi:MAG: acetaldehyde dehydrogenase [Paenibacillus sp.]|jgi:alcohol dehydrogenase|nr:acetaldehyde dehydrogenase [Paenibacillus sp.]
MLLNRVFRYEIPTVIEFGNGSINQLAEHVQRLGGRKALIVGDPGVVRAGIVDRLNGILQKASVPCELFSDIQSDPDIESVEKGTALGKEAGCDIVVGVGGGSSLDTAKAIGLMLGNAGNIRDYVGINKVPSKGAPVIAVPTTAGTGSEVTVWSVLSDRQNKIKLSVGSAYNCPDLALCDPELTLSLPPQVTAATGMDALTHALESYVNKATQPISEGLAVQAMKLIARSLRLAVVQGENLQARYDMLMASLLAAMAFNSTRLGLAHALGLPLGAHFHIPHGTVNAILLPEVMQFNVIGSPDKFAEIASIFGERTEHLSRLEAAEKSVHAVRRLKEEVGITQTLSDFGLREEHLGFIAEEAMLSGNVPVNPRKPALEDLKLICRAAMS